MKAKKARVIAIANHKGGCGKTTTSVNLAYEFGRAGLSVLLIDLDTQANASLHIGKKHPSEVSITAAELLTGNPELLPQAIEEETHFPNVALIYGGLGLERAEDNLRDTAPRPSEELKSKIAPLMEGFYDVVIIDCPPSLKHLTSNGLTAADYVIIPIESGSQYGLYGMSDLLRHIERIKRINPSLSVLGGLLVRHDERQSVCKTIQAQAAAQIGKLFETKIPSSTNVNKSAVMNLSVHGVDRSSKVAREFRALAQEVGKAIGFRIKGSE